MNWFNNLKRVIVREAPTILSVTGVVGFLSGTVLAVKATPAAIKADEKWWKEHGKDFDESCDYPEGGWKRKGAVVWQTFKNKAPHYAPAAAVLLMSAASVLASSHISKRRYIAITALQYATQEYAERLKDSITENLSNKKADEVLSKASAPAKDPGVVILGGGDVLCWDNFSKRFFKVSDVETVRSVVNDMNETMYLEGWVPLNDFYYGVGIEVVEYGNDIGWPVEGGPVSIRWSATLTPENKPCVAIEFEAGPKHIYAQLGRKK